MPGNQRLYELRTGLSRFARKHIKMLYFPPAVKPTDKKKARTHADAAAS
jgi:hypothetical protein